MSIFQKEIQKLYYSGKSMSEIAKILNCSLNKVVYWMDKLKIQRRSHSESAYIKANPNGNPFKIKTILSPTERELNGLGLGLYWGEGEKVSKGHVSIANSDVYLILKFCEFLLTICQVNPLKVHYSIVCFNDSIIEDVCQYWSKTLGISPEKFGKIVQIPTQGKGIYIKKSKSGVCTITVSNTKLKNWILQELEKFKN